MGNRSSSAMYAGGCALGFAIVLLLFGLIFVLGSQGKATTLLVGLLLIAAAIALGVFTIRRLSVAAGQSPDAIDERILNLATMSGGEVTPGEATGALQASVADVSASLERLVSKGLAQMKVRDGNLYYVFPGIATVRKIKRCAYCGTEFPVREPGMKCASCGGNLELVDAHD
jgi:hypothetical protein